MMASNRFISSTLYCIWSHFVSSYLLSSTLSRIVLFYLISSYIILFYFAFFLLFLLISFYLILSYLILCRINSSMSDNLLFTSVYFFINTHRVTHGPWIHSARESSKYIAVCVENEKITFDRAIFAEKKRIRPSYVLHCCYHYPETPKVHNVIITSPLHHARSRTFISSMRESQCSPLIKHYLTSIKLDLTVFGADQNAIQN